MEMNEKKQSQMGQNEFVEKMPVGKAIGFSAYNFAMTLSGLLVAYVTYYVTDSLYLSAGVISGILLFSRFFDGFTDILAGFLIDKSHSKRGKARPFVLFGILAWVAFIAMFATPDISNSGKAVYIFITYNLNTSVFMTLFGCCRDTLLRRMVLDQRNRMRTLTISGAFMGIGAMVVSVIVPLLIAQIGGEAKGWTMMAVAFGVVGIVCTILCYLLCKEYPDEMLPKKGVREEKTTIKDFLQSSFKNKYLLMFMLVQFIYYLITNTAATVGTYYFANNLGNITLFAAISLAGFAVYPIMPFVPKLVARFGKRKLFVVGFVISAVGCLIRMLSGANLMGLMVGNILYSVGTMPVTFASSAITIDCMEWGEHKTGVRAEAIYSSFNNVAMKCASGIGLGLMGLALAKGGYDGSLAVQPDSALFAINLVYHIVPIGLFLVSAVVMVFFDVEKRLEEVKRS